MVEPEPSATSPALAPAVAPWPTATPSVTEATASGPAAVLSVPVAWLSARVEVAWKYLMPPPLLMLSTLVFTVSTEVLVAKSWLPFTASVEVAAIRPAATLVMVRSAPGAPTLTVLVGAVPAKL